MTGCRAILSLVERYRAWRHSRRQLRRLRLAMLESQLYEACLWGPLLTSAGRPSADASAPSAKIPGKHGGKRTLRNALARAIRLLNPLPWLDLLFPEFPAWRVRLLRQFLLNLLCLGLQTLSDHLSPKSPTSLRGSMWSRFAKRLKSSLTNARRSFAQTSSGIKSASSQWWKAALNASRCTVSVSASVPSISNISALSMIQCPLSNAAVDLSAPAAVVVAAVPVAAAAGSV